MRHRESYATTSGLNQGVQCSQLYTVLSYIKCVFTFSMATNWRFLSAVYSVTNARLAINALIQGSKGQGSSKVHYIEIDGNEQAFATPKHTKGMTISFKVRVTRLVVDYNAVTIRK